VKPEEFSGYDFLRFNGSSCLSGCTFTGSQNIAVTAVPLSGMAAGGGYSDRVDVTSGSTVLHFDVTFQITSGTAGPLTFSPTSLNFSSAVNGSNQSQGLQVTASSSTQWSVSSSASWLSVTNAGVTMTGSQNLSVTVTPSGLTQNTYNGVL